MADAPQVVPRTDYPETSWKYEAAVPEYHDKSVPTYAHTAYVEEEAPKKDTRILGLRRRTFWIIVVLAIVVIGGGVVGASVGGTLAVKRSGYELKGHNLEMHLLIAKQKQTQRKFRIAKCITVTISVTIRKRFISQCIKCVAYAISQRCIGLKHRPSSRIRASRLHPSQHHQHRVSAQRVRLGSNMGQKLPVHLREAEERGTRWN